MQKLLTFACFAALAAWFAVGLPLAAGVFFATHSAPALAALAVAWCLPPLAVRGLWRLCALAFRRIPRRSPEVARFAGEAAVLAAKVAKEL